MTILKSTQPPCQTHPVFTPQAAQRSELVQQRQQWTSQQQDLSALQQQCAAQSAQLQQQQSQLATAQQRLAAAERRVEEEAAALVQAQAALRVEGREAGVQAAAVEARMSACLRLEGGTFDTLLACWILW